LTYGLFKGASQGDKMKYFNLLCLVLVFFIGTGIYSVSAQQPTGAKPPQPVFVTEAKKDTFVDRVEALGTLRANETVVLTAKVTEQVTAVNFEDGQRVSAGDVLVEMMNTQESAELDAEQATANEAKQQLDRIIPLVKSGAASESVLDLRQREYQTAQARLDGIKSRISDRMITAPFGGVLGMRNISVGVVLQPGAKITTLDDDSVMKLDFSVPAVFLSAIQVGLEIEAKSNSFDGRIFKGKIISIDSQIDPVTRSITVRALIPNEEKLLKPGLLMRVEILKDPRQAIILPEEAIIPLGRDNHVFVVEDEGGKTVAKKRMVTLGSRRPGDVEIVTGLSGGEKVVTHGTMNVIDGGDVSINATQTGNEHLPDLLKQQNSAKKEER
jgi:membrane fusion protein, multidrug efflux system